MTLDDLKRKLDRLSPVKVAFVARMVDALSTPPPPKAEVREPSWINGSADWIEYFGLALSVHHSMTPDPLALTAFETAFRNACESVGWSVEERAQPTRRFVDIAVEADGAIRKLSLKSTAASRLSETTAHVSKLTEAAWIQDARTPAARRDRMRELFREYRQAVDAIVMLRAFRRTATLPPQRYQLIEIPARIFDSIEHAALEDFRRDAPVVECALDGRTVARVAADRSDAKISVRGVSLSACVVHAEWTQE